jgi:hypothetical protein
MVFSAAPFRRLSPETNNKAPTVGTRGVLSDRPISEPSTPAAAGRRYVDQRHARRTVEELLRRSGEIGLANSALIDSECPVATGTRTQVPLTRRSGCQDLVALLRSLILVGLAGTVSTGTGIGTTLNAMGATYLTG